MMNPESKRETEAWSEALKEIEATERELTNALEDTDHTGIRFGSENIYGPETTHFGMSLGNEIVLAQEFLNNLKELRKKVLSKYPDLDPQGVQRMLKFERETILGRLRVAEAFFKECKTETESRWGRFNIGEYREGIEKKAHSENETRVEAVRMFLKNKGEDLSALSEGDLRDLRGLLANVRKTAHIGRRKVFMDEEKKAWLIKLHEDLKALEEVRFGGPRDGAQWE